MCGDPQAAGCDPHQASSAMQRELGGRGGEGSMQKLGRGRGLPTVSCQLQAPLACRLSTHNTRGNSPQLRGEQSSLTGAPGTSRGLTWMRSRWPLLADSISVSSLPSTPAPLLSPRQGGRASRLSPRLSASLSQSTDLGVRGHGVWAELVKQPASDSTVVALPPGLCDAGQVT